MTSSDPPASAAPPLFSSPPHSCPFTAANHTTAASISFWVEPRLFTISRQQFTNPPTALCVLPALCPHLSHNSFDNFHPRSLPHLLFFSFAPLPYLSSLQEHNPTQQSSSHVWELIHLFLRFDLPLQRFTSPLSLSVSLFLSLFLSLSFGRGMKGPGPGHVKSTTALL